MKAPKLLKNESATSFKRRVKAWEQRTGQKYPRSRFGKSDEERILDGAITTTSRLDPKTDYSKDYDLDQVAKEEALSPGYYQEYSESEEGKRFLAEQEELQGNIDQGLKEQAYARAASGKINYDEVELPGEEDKTNFVQTPSPTWGMNDTDRVNAANIQKVVYAADQNKKLSEIGGKEYVTDYQTAVRNAGGPWGDVEQYYGEDVLDSAGNRVRKSNVFTLDEDGNPMGVKTRRQRLAADLKTQEAQNLSLIHI